MMVDYGGIISEALKKDAFSTRSLPMIVVTVSAAICIYMISMDFIFNFFLPFISHGIYRDIPAELLKDMLSFAIRIVVILLLFWILSLFAGGVIMKQAGEECHFRECASFVMRKMLSMISAGILISFIPNVLSFGLSEVPYVGSLLSFAVFIFVELITFVVYPVIILDNSGAINAISSSIHHFFTHKLEVFIMWLLVAVISLIILLIFSLPFIAYFIYLIFLLFSPGSHHRYHGDDMTYLIYDALVRTLPFLIVSTLILAVGIAVTTAFSYGVKARYYASVRESTSVKERTDESQ